MIKRLGLQKGPRMNWLLGLLITFVCCGFYAALVSFRTMPIAEGWYTEYSWMINNGSLPYRDFEYLFFPLYLFLMAGFTNIFGYSIIALRILGVLVFAGIGVALYCIFAKLFDNFSGFVAAVLTAVFLQSEAVQIFYDYIRFHDLFAYISAYFLLTTALDCWNGEVRGGKRRFLITGAFSYYVIPLCVLVLAVTGMIITPFGEHPKRWLMFLLGTVGAAAVLAAVVIGKATTAQKLREQQIPVSAIICGIFAAAECMVKQSNGMLMILMICVFLPYCAIVLSKKNFWKAFAGYLSGLVSAFLILAVYLMATDTVGDFMRCCFGSAISAKGGLLRTLFGWIVPTIQGTLMRKDIITVAVILYIAVVYYVRRASTERMSFGWKLLAPCGVITLMGVWGFVEVGTVAGMLYGRNDTYVPGLVFIPCALFFFVYACWLLICRIKGEPVSGIWARLFPLFPILGVIFAQGYGAGMSGGLCTSQVALSIGVIAGFCLHAALGVNARVMCVWMLAISTFMAGTFISRKTIQAYDWWGLTQGDISQHTETADVPLLEGIKMRPVDKLCYETVYHDVVSNTKEGDNIFVFPHAPILYTITDRHSVTYSQVQWFDVSSPATIQMDIETLRENVPTMIVYVTLPEAVYNGHESSFATYQTRNMSNFLLYELIPEYDYTLLSEVDIGGGYVVSTYLLPEQ